jgi:two-component system LytT family response regulator
MKVLIVDDEHHCRATLRALLKERDDVTEIIEAEDGEEAIRMIAALGPELIFLDVQMPRLTGLEVAASLPLGANPEIVFVTAYDQHAIRAFELHATDYLLKPFSDERLYECMEHIRTRFRSRGAAVTGAVISPGQPSIILKVGGGVVFCRTTEIRWIEGNGDYLNIYTSGKPMMIRDTIRGMQERLQGRGFLRIHKSILVNRARISGMMPIHSGDYMLEMDDGTRLRASRSFKEEFRLLLS